VRPKAVVIEAGTLSHALKLPTRIGGTVLAAMPRVPSNVYPAQPVSILVPFLTAINGPDFRTLKKLVDFRQK
jgi:hypothetical protein